AHDRANPQRAAPARRRAGAGDRLRGRWLGSRHGAGGVLMEETTMNQAAGQAFRLDIRDDGVAVITIDVPGETQNTLKAEFSDQVKDLFAQLERDARIKGVVFFSGKPGSFIAGRSEEHTAALRHVNSSY